MKPVMYKFSDLSLQSDVFDSKGKIIRYKDVFCIACNEDQARGTSKLDEKYVIVKSFELGDGWV